MRACGLAAPPGALLLNPLPAGYLPWSPGALLVNPLPAGGLEWVAAASKGLAGECTPLPDLC